jgi:hypothetical protein
MLLAQLSSSYRSVLLYVSISVKKVPSFILGTPAAIVCIALVVGHQYYLHEKL